MQEKFHLRSGKLGIFGNACFYTLRKWKMGLHTLVEVFAGFFVVEIGKHKIKQVY